MSIELPRKTPVAASEDHPIKPELINTDPDVHFWSAFENSEAEVSAKWIVRFLQHKGQSWGVVDVAELNTFYNERRKAALEAAGKSFHAEKFWFNGIDTHYMVKVGEGQYRVTQEFVGRCHLSSPR